MTSLQDIEKRFIPEFEEYIRQGEPNQKTKASLWQTAIGLQAVDGLKTSEYLRKTARRNIEGEINLEEAHKLIHGYYQKRAAHHESINDEEAEADRAASNIARILASQTLAFSTNGLIALHRRIFEGVFPHAGKIRQYDITKKEWILREDTVNYLNWEDLRDAIDYDIKEEKAFSYSNISNDEMIAHISHFVSNLWQIHPFQEGNTRTTAVFTILYLRSIGFDVDNDLFAKHAWYFRNALVRACYKSARYGIDYSPQYLERFFRNLLFGEQWDLRSRYLYINPPEEWQNQPYGADATTNTKQAQDKHGISTGQVQDKHRTSLENTLTIDDENTIRLVRTIGHEKLSIKEIMATIGLKGRDNFLNLYLNPAIDNGFVRLLYPDSPRHPRQKYLLTTKGILLFDQVSKT